MSGIGINRVVLVGNLTRDPELRAIPSGTSVCQLRVACSGRRRKAEGGWEEKPNYFDVSVFGPQAENVSRYLHRGRAVAIDGRLEWREWQAPDESKRQAVSIVADNVQFLGAAGEPARDGEAPDGDLAAVGADAGQDGEDLSF